MRILQLVQKPQRRGAEIFASQLSTWLRAHGHTLRTIYLYPHRHPKALPLVAGDRVLEGNETHLFERALSVHPVLLRRVREAILEFDPDILQLNGARSVKYGALASPRGKRRWLVLYRNLSDPAAWLTGVRRRLLYRLVIAPRLDSIAAISASVMPTLRRCYGTSKPIVHIPTGVDLEALEPRRSRAEVRAGLGIAPAAPMVLYLGNLSAEKNVGGLLRLFRAVREARKDVRLVLAGGGPQEIELRGQAAALGLGESVVFVGVQEEPAEFLHASDVLALPSSTEGVPAVLLEAGACGLPVVATSVGGVPECVFSGETGLLVPPGDEAGFAAALVRLLGDQAERERMGAVARQRVRAEFGLDTIAPRFLALYRQMLGHSAAVS